MGKSAAGKDTVFKALMKDRELGLQNIIPYTTRPIREGERNGVEYFFTDEAGFQKWKEQGRIIEERMYHTRQGLWRYFTADDDQLGDGSRNYLIIGTLEAYGKLQAYFGRDRLLPVMIELEDGVRLRRALERELDQEHPQYEEMCRRFLADCEDFSEDKIREAGISRRFPNNDLEECLCAIRSYIINEIRTDGK
jgi:guanylate kinase